LGGGRALKKLRRAEGGANIFGVFRVKNHYFTPKNHIFSNCEGGAKHFGVFRMKNHYFTPKNHIFSNCGGRRETFLGISCEKSRFYANKKIIFCPILGGGLDPPLNRSQLSTTCDVCVLSNINVVFIPPLPKGEGGYTVLPLPSKIFFVTFFSVTVDGRNLILGHKRHIGIPTGMKIERVLTGFLIG
jgi:hypothetical protein